VGAEARRADRALGAVRGVLQQGRARLAGSPPTAPSR
jgi:hypothetical protein